MTSSASLVVAAALMAVLAAAPVRAADQMVAGKIVFLKNNLDPSKRKLKYLTKENASSNVIVGNPMTAGATFELALQPELGTGSQQCFTLPALGWSQLGSIGFKYKDLQGDYGAVKVAAIKSTPSGTFILKVVANGAIGPIALAPPTRTAEADAFFDVAFGDRYCAVFGGEFLADGVAAFKAKDAPAPAACASVPLTCSPSGAFLE